MIICDKNFYRENIKQRPDMVEIGVKDVGGIGKLFPDAIFIISNPNEKISHVLVK